MTLDEFFARLESVPWDAWTLRRFGLTPDKLRYRLRNVGMPKVLCVSLPKSGTHLVERALCLHPRLYRSLRPTVAPGMRTWDGLDEALRRLRPGALLVAHLPHDASYGRILARRGARAICTIRDPRDVVLSQVHFIMGRRFHPHHARFAELRTLSQRLELAIRGDEGATIPSIRERLERYAGWLDGSSHVVRFEDLVGPKGGGDLDVQRRSVSDLYVYLGIDVSPDHVERVCGNLFSTSSPTFRRGAIGQWRERFPPHIKELFVVEAGPVMDRYGYGV
jgi:hypothetical protein